jgi:hypothetical protein
MIWLVKGFTVAPTYFYRPPLPVQTITGRDANLNGENLPARAYKFTEPGQAPEEIGAARPTRARCSCSQTRMPAPSSSPNSASDRSGSASRSSLSYEAASRAAMAVRG